MRRVEVLEDGSAGRFGDVIRRYWDKGDECFWLEVRLDKKTVCRGPESHFRYVQESGHEDEPID